MPSAASRNPLIVADIGATNARFGVIAAAGHPIEELRHFEDDNFIEFEDCLAAYLQTLPTKPPKRIAIGAAGPLAHRTIKLTNRDWTIDPERIRARFSVETHALVNDLVAMAAGIALAPSKAFQPLPGPLVESARRSLVIAVGTGLGVAWFERDDGKIRLHPTEAGHMSMAPISEADGQLLAALQHKLGHVSFETVVSGSGIPRVYAALDDHVTKKLATTEAVLAAAESGSDRLAGTVLDLALVALATFARDLVLALGGVDEIVFCGGLGLRLKSALSDRIFLRRLRDLSEVPIDFSHIGVRLALDDKLPLDGVANLAFGLINLPPARAEA